MSEIMDRAAERELYTDETPVEVNTSTSNVVIVDNVPKTEMNRYEKLISVIRKIFSSYGTIIDEGLYIPVEGEAGKEKTCGFAFIEYENADMATRAVMEGNGKRLDNAHTLLVNHYDDFEKFSKVPAEYVPPKISDYESKVNLNSWLLDGRDMFVVRYQHETQIFFNDPFKRANDYGRQYKYGGEREKAQDKHWCDRYVEWSARGSYLATFHDPGIVVWGGENFERLGRFPHQGVECIQFSPNEKYLITCNWAESKPDKPAECFIVWDVRTGKKLRSFEKDAGEKPQWPVMKWSHDDKYVARKAVDAIAVYETPLMGLLDKKSIKIPSVQEFAWSPSSNLIAYYVPEKSNGPATVAVMELPSRQVKREKHLYGVVDIRLHWHEQGDYLCVKVSRKKTKKTIVTSFEIFRIRDKDMPIETIELETTSVTAFAWEPHGHRFAIAYPANEAAKTNHVAIYSVKNNKVKLTKVFENRQCNRLFWSPLGTHLVLAGLGPLNGQLEWVDCDAGEPVGLPQEHFQCSDVEWDPSGRYVITSATQPLGAEAWKYTMDQGYNLWSMLGQLLATSKMEQCYQVMWRPRPANLLSKEQLAELKKNLKEKYWRTFEQEDEAIRQSQLTGAAKERQELKAAWKAYRQEKEKQWLEERAMRRELRGGLASDDENDYEFVEQLVEEEVSREEEFC